jgi:soluble lytic murein transglycosylase-like protein
VRWLVATAGLTSLGVVAHSLWPLAEPPKVRALDPVGAKAVRPPDFDRIDEVLERRAPGWGLPMREHVAVAVAEESARAGFDPLLILAVIAVESEFQEQAVSPVGAKGLMQIRPATLYFLAEREGVKLSREELESDPALCVRLGIRYLESLKKQFGDLDLALMAYNAGPTRLYQSLLKRDIELFRGYPRAVRRHFSELRAAHGEPGDWTFALREQAAGKLRTHPE